MTNVIKRRALQDEVFLVAHTVGGAMAVTTLGRGALSNNGRSQLAAEFGSPASRSLA